jgi:hypothetical protein
VSDAPPEEPSADPRDSLIREQEERIGEQERIAAQGERIAALGAMVAGLRDRLEAAQRSGSRNSGNSSMPPGSDDLPGRGQPSRQQRRVAEKKRGKQPGSPGASMTWNVPDRTGDHYPGGACSCGTDLRDAEDLGVTRSYQREEIPVAPAERVQHDLHAVRCPGCGREHAAARPASRQPRCRSGRGCVPCAFTWSFTSMCRSGGAVS